MEIASSQFSKHLREVEFFRYIRFIRLILQLVTIILTKTLSNRWYPFFFNANRPIKCVNFVNSVIVWFTFNGGDCRVAHKSVWFARIFLFFVAAFICNCFMCRWYWYSAHVTAMCVNCIFEKINWSRLLLSYRFNRYNQYLSHLESRIIQKNWN